MENDNSFSQDIETILESLRINCVILSNFHRKKFLYFRNQIKYYRIPVLILSSVASVWSIAGRDFLEQNIVSLVNCGLGMVASLITSIELFVGIASSMENQLIASREYYQLAIDIYKILSLERHNRMVNGREFLNEKFALYEKLREQTEVLDKKVNDELTHTSKLQELQSESSVEDV